LGGFGSLPDAREGCVDFQHVREVLGALKSEVVTFETESGNLALGGADTKFSHASAHLMDTRVVLTLSASAIAMMPSVV
jgi:hypothetical protein